jgi:hypothetical protein
MTIPPFDVRLRMSREVVALAATHVEAAEGDDLATTATFVDGTIVVTASGKHAQEIASFLDAFGIARAERFTGDNWPKPRDETPTA